MEAGTRDDCPTYENDLVHWNKLVNVQRRPRESASPNKCPIHSPRLSQPIATPAFMTAVQISLFKIRRAVPCVGESHCA
jgi:hypothetical protein